MYLPCRVTGWRRCGFGLRSSKQQDSAGLHLHIVIATHFACSGHTKIHLQHLELDTDNSVMPKPSPLPP